MSVVTVVKRIQLLTVLKNFFSQAKVFQAVKTCLDCILKNEAITSTASRSQRRLSILILLFVFPALLESRGI